MPTGHAVAVDTLYPKITRRKFLHSFCGALASAAAGAAYMRWTEPPWFEVTSTNVALPPARCDHAGALLRVLHLSDLHAYRPWVSLEHIAQKPDVICLTGDFITADYDDFAAYAEVLRPLTSAAPTFACLGNHDCGRGRAFGVRALLATAGVELLHNASREIAVRGRRVQLIGVGDWWTGECRPALAFAFAPPRQRALRLVLNHNPDAKGAFANHDWDLMLCGHTHGGQIGIPALARLLAPVQDKRFIAGLYPWDGRQLFITRGVGNLHHARLFCRPEVSLLNVI
jgi:predicted MPP superfamily phosphohydrolase